MHIQKTMAAASVSLLLGLALPVAALTVGDVTGAALGVNADGSGSAQVRTSASGTASASGEGQSGLGTQVRGVVHELLGASSTVRGTSSTDASASGTADASVSVLPLMITRADVDAQDETAVSVATPADVHANSDLSSYIAGQMKADANLQEVQATDDALSVTYSVPAKLFGIIPISVNATTLVDATGGVTVSYPWYSFLLTTKPDLESGMQARVDSVLRGGAAAGAQGSATVNAQAQASAVSQLSAQTRAELISEIRAAMRSSLDASAATDASGTASIQ